jgi:transposase
MSIKNDSSSILQQKYDDLQSSHRNLEKEILYLKEQLKWFQRQVFGQRSEKSIANFDENQLLFDELKNIEPLPIEEKKVVSAHSRRKSRREGQDKIQLPDHLPVEKKEID